MIEKSSHLEGSRRSGLFAAMRWIGSPRSSLTAVLYNFKKLDVYFTCKTKDRSTCRRFSLLAGGKSIHNLKERNEYSDDEDPNDLFEETDVEEVIKTPPKSKRKPEIKSSRKKRKSLPKIQKKTEPRKRPPSSAASPSNSKRSRPNTKKSIPPPPPPCEPPLSFSRQIRASM